MNRQEKTIFIIVRNNKKRRIEDMEQWGEGPAVTPPRPIHVSNQGESK